MFVVQTLFSTLSGNNTYRMTPGRFEHDANEEVMACLSVSLVKFLHTKFPESPDLVESLSHLEQKESELNLCATWVAKLTEPLNPKKAKYAKAIERLTSKPPSLYHALMHKDFASLLDDDGSFLFFKSVEEKVNSQVLSQDEINFVWSMLTKITRHAYDAGQIELPENPTRSAIEANIKRRKDRSEESSSVMKSFRTKFDKLCSLCNIEGTGSLDEKSVRELMKRWQTFVGETDGTRKNTDMCVAKDASVLSRLVEHVPELKAVIKLPFDEEMWECVTQMNNFCVVQKSIPTKMMGKIESMASKIADDILSGKADMSKLDLSEIGQEVLSGCNEEDMSSFANNIESLLPVVQALAK